MLLMIPLLITGVNGTVISVVYGPVALRRGGASPVPRVIPSITLLANMIHLCVKGRTMRVIYA